MHASTHRPAFTLVELTVSVGIATILLAALASAIVVAGHALPDRVTSSATLVSTADVTEQMVAELACAKSFTQRSATAVEFSVADRTGDAADDTIRYEWSGVAGAGLTRRLNASTAVVVLDDVYELGLSFNLSTITVSQTTQQDTDSGEVLLNSFDGWLGVTPTTLYLNTSAANWMTEYFPVSFPADAINCQITRVRMKMRAGLASATTFTVGIHRPSAGGTLPEAAPVGTPFSQLNSALTASFAWVDCTFSDALLTSTDTAAVIVVKGTASDTVRVQYLNGATAPADATYANWTTNTGASSSPTAATKDRYDAPFYAWGSYTTSTSQTTDTTRYFVTGVGIEARAGGDVQTRVTSAAQVLNAPEVAGP